LRLSAFGGLIAARALWQRVGVGALLTQAGICKRAQAVDVETLALVSVCQPLVGTTSEAALVRQTVTGEGDPLVAARPVAQRTLNRFLSHPCFDFPAFFRACVGEIVPGLPRLRAKGNVLLRQGVLVVDDTPVSKRGQHLPGIRKLYDHTKGIFYSGYELVTVALARGKGPAWPLDFLPQPLPPPQRQRKRGRPKKGALPKVKQSKLTTALALITRVLASGMSARFVTFDCWYTAVWLLKGVAALSLIFVAPVKRNRQVVWEGRRVQARTLLRMAKRRAQRVFLVELPNFGRVRLACVRRPVRGGGVQWEILITNDLTLPYKTMKAIYRARWSIEVLFEEAKQRFGLLHFHNRTMAAILAHLAFTWLALLLAPLSRVVYAPLRAFTLGEIKRAVIAVNVLVSTRVGRWTVGFTENALCLKLFKGTSLCLVSG
jgi:hypothetical protein